MQNLSQIYKKTHPFRCVFHYVLLNCARQSLGITVSQARAYDHLGVGKPEASFFCKILSVIYPKSVIRVNRILPSFARSFNWLQFVTGSFSFAILLMHFQQFYRLQIRTCRYAQEICCHCSSVSAFKVTFRKQFFFRKTFGKVKHILMRLCQ